MIVNNKGEKETIMAFGERLTEVKIYKWGDEEIPSGVWRKDDCLYCNKGCEFIVIGQRVGHEFGGYVQRRCCNSEECKKKAIKVVEEETGLEYKN